MRSTLSLHSDRGDQPQVEVTDSHGLELARVHLSDDLFRVTLCSTEPDYLRALARACDEAAVRLSAALDARAAHRVNAGAQLDGISARLDATTTAWASAGHPPEGPEHDAREAAFADLRAWNSQVGAA